MFVWSVCDTQATGDVSKNSYWLESRDGWESVCVPPKNGSSMWKRLFLKKRYPHLSVVHPHLLNATLALRTHPHDAPETPVRVSIYRDPVERFVSAYEDKIANPRNCESMKPAGFDCANPSPVGVLNALLSGSYRNEHFMPQSKLCGQHTLVLHLEDIHLWYPWFINHYGLQAETQGWNASKTNLFHSRTGCFFQCKGLSCEDMSDSSKTKVACKETADRRFVITSHETDHSMFGMTQEIGGLLNSYYAEDMSLAQRSDTSWSTVLRVGAA